MVGKKMNSCCTCHRPVLPRSQWDSLHREVGGEMLTWKPSKHQRQVNSWHE